MLIIETNAKQRPKSSLNDMVRHCIGPVSVEFWRSGIGLARVCDFNHRSLDETDQNFISRHRARDETSQEKFDFKQVAD